MSTADLRFWIYRFVVEQCRTPTFEEIVAHHGVGEIATRTALQDLHHRHELVLLPQSDQIWMAMPFSAVPTTVQVEVGGTARNESDRAPGVASWWANCAWDAFGILAALDVDGTIRSTCPDCGFALKLEVIRGQALAQEWVVHFLLPAARWWENIGFT